MGRCSPLRIASLGACLLLLSACDTSPTDSIGSAMVTWWWADAAAALVVSVSILKDGITNIKAAVTGLSDTRATRFDNSDVHPLTDDVEKLARSVARVAESRARVRDQGHIFHTEMFVVPVKGTIPSPGQPAQLTKQIGELDWKLQDTVVVVVEKLDPNQVPPPADI